MTKVGQHFLRIEKSKDGSIFNTFSIAINATIREEVNIVVYDLSGKVAFSNVIIVQNNGPQVYTIEPIQKLAPGIYMIVGSLNQKIQSKRLFVQ